VGKLIALSLAERGCDVTIHFHQSAQAATQTASEIYKLGGKVLTIQADLSHHRGVMDLFQGVDDAGWGLDLLVNSAAIMRPNSLLEANELDWETTINLNLKGTFFCIQQASQRMRQCGGGAIVNISDVIGLRPWRRFPIHSISKAGVEMLTRVAALELAPEIRVNAVAPGPVLKPDHMRQERWDQITSSLPLARGGDPKDVARAVIFLFENDYITGETLVVDGGNVLV
jgi:pteridine reductase